MITPRLRRLFARIGFAPMVGMGVLASPAVIGAQVSFEMLHAFSDDDGALPAGALIQATDGWTKCS